MSSTIVGLDAHERAALLQLARESIITGITGEQIRARDMPAKLTQLCGAFVTLHRSGRLRGCIGRLRAISPLAQTIQEMARAAAFSDPRFRPITLPEVPDLELEISVLSAFVELPAADVARIEIGVHGLYISQHGRAGLLLPQVAPEWGWGVDEFLAQTCAKAGLPADAWRSGAKIETFTAEIFGDNS